MPKLLIKIRRRETPLFIFLYKVASYVKRVNMPDFLLPFYRVLGLLRSFLISSVRKIFVFLYYDPLFRSQCKKVGKNLNYLKTRQGLPYFHGPVCIYLGDNVTVHGRMAFTAASLLDKPSFTVGDNSYLGPGLSVSIAREISIGTSCLISSNVKITDNDGHPIDPFKREMGDSISLEEVSPVRIGKNVWIGEGASILKGVTIGDGAIVGAGSIVVHDVPPYTIVAGNPAEFIKNVICASEDPES